MSSTGFFHSRLCGTLADVGCWAFILGAFVIHPPKKTQPPPKSISWGPGAVALGTYDAGLFLHSLLNNAIRSSLLLVQGGKQYINSGQTTLRLYHCRSNTRNRQFHIV